MSAAASGRTARASASAGMTRPVSGGVKKLRGPDTVRAQLKVEDPDEVAKGCLTSPDPLARLLTNLPGDVPVVRPPSRFSRCAYISCAWQAS
jgi:hypothetical protein